VAADAEDAFTADPIMAAPATAALVFRKLRRLVLAVEGRSTLDSLSSMNSSFFLEKNRSLVDAKMVL
jgi:hypothetical protein